MCVKRGTANMGQWSAKLTFHFNLALGEWEGGESFKSWEIFIYIFLSTEFKHSKREFSGFLKLFQLV